MSRKVKNSAEFYLMVEAQNRSNIAQIEKDAAQWELVIKDVAFFDKISSSPDLSEAAHEFTSIRERTYFPTEKRTSSEKEKAAFKWHRFATMMRRHHVVVGYNAMGENISYVEGTNHLLMRPTVGLKSPRPSLAQAETKTQAKEQNVLDLAQLHCARFENTKKMVTCCCENCRLNVLCARLCNQGPDQDKH